MRQSSLSACPGCFPGRWPLAPGAHNVSGSRGLGDVDSFGSGVVRGKVIGGNNVGRLNRRRRRRRRRWRKRRRGRTRARRVGWDKLGDEVIITVGEFVTALVAIEGGTEGSDVNSLFDAA